MKSTVSVVIPTYKASVFIRGTLASVFAQTRLPDEVIVADDCSPDDTVALVEEIAKTAPVPVRVIRLEKNSGGPAKPLNVGIEAARGDLIATLDHDDTFPPNKLADQVQVFEAHSDLGLVFGGLLTSGQDVDRQRGFIQNLEAGVAAIPGDPFQGGVRLRSSDALAAILRLRSFLGSCSNMLFPKVVWRVVAGFDELTRVSCDLAFLAAVTSRFDLARVPTPSAVWQVHPDSFYQRSGGYVRLKDQFRVFRRLRSDRLTSEGRDELIRLVADLRAGVRQEAFAEAYELRQRGAYRAAAGRLWDACLLTGPWAAGLSGLAKLIPHRLGRRWSVSR